MTTLIVPVILAGGQGTRLWPLSRSSRPKQFLPLAGPISLYQNTLQRIGDPLRYTAPIVVANSEYRFIVAEQAAELDLPLACVMLEPVARNTAAAIASAALHAQTLFGADAILHILPSDHIVETGKAYWSALDSAVAAAKAGQLVTFGILPQDPQTGFGYIKSAAQIGAGASKVERFVEKPQQQAAQAMLAEGGYLWNSGMFVVKASDFLAECEALAPDTLSGARQAAELAYRDLDFLRLDEEAFARCPNISVDHAIFEKTSKASVVAADFGWSDLGSWDAVWKSAARDVEGNFARGPVTLESVTNSLVISDHAHVAVSGLEDISVIATNDAIYVGKLSAAQKVGELVARLRTNEQTAGLTDANRTTYRPWGGYTSVLSGDRFQVKRLFVKPGKKLSLQMHHHRAEHWVVVRGTAEVTLDGSVTTLSENQSIYLPLGCVHRLANPGKIELELIEVQTGPYLGEDDIIRIEDDFGRN